MVDRGILEVVLLTISKHLRPIVLAMNDGLSFVMKIGCAALLRSLLEDAKHLVARMLSLGRIQSILKSITTLVHIGSIELILCPENLPSKARGLHYVTRQADHNFENVYEFLPTTQYVFAFHLQMMTKSNSLLQTM